MNTMQGANTAEKVAKPKRAPYMCTVQFAVHHKTSTTNFTVIQGIYVTFCWSHIWLCLFMTVLACVHTIPFFSLEPIYQSLPFVDYNV